MFHFLSVFLLTFLALPREAQVYYWVLNIRWLGSSQQRVEIIFNYIEPFSIVFIYTKGEKKNGHVMREFHEK